jgi:hypothetical protein
MIIEFSLKKPMLTKQNTITSVSKLDISSMDESELERLNKQLEDEILKFPEGKSFISNRKMPVITKSKSTNIRKVPTSGTVH